MYLLSKWLSSEIPVVSVTVRLCKTSLHAVLTNKNTWPIINNFCLSIIVCVHGQGLKQLGSLSKSCEIFCLVVISFIGMTKTVHLYCQNGAKMCLSLCLFPSGSVCIFCFRVSHGGGVVHLSASVHWHIRAARSRTGSFGPIRVRISQILLMWIILW